MCKHAHTTLTSTYSQTQMTSGFSLIIVFLNPWFSCGGGLRTIGDLGGWRGAKDNCGLGIFASWTMRFIFGSQFFFFSVLFADPAFLAHWDLQMPSLTNCKPGWRWGVSPWNWEGKCNSEQQFDIPGSLPFDKLHSLAIIPIELWRPSFAPVYTHSALTATADLYEEYGLESGTNFLF